MFQRRYNNGNNNLSSGNGYQNGFQGGSSGFQSGFQGNGSSSLGSGGGFQSGFSSRNFPTSNNTSNNMGLNNIPNNNWSKPERISSVGTVTEMLGQTGIINDEIYFDLNVCIGPWPKLCDQVAFEAISTPFARFKWTATKAQVISSMQINWSQDGSNNQWGSLSSVSNNLSSITSLANNLETLSSLRFRNELPPVLSGRLDRDQISGSRSHRRDDDRRRGRSGRDRRERRGDRRDRRDYRDRVEEPRRNDRRSGGRRSSGRVTSGGGGRATGGSARGEGSRLNGVRSNGIRRSNRSGPRVRPRRNRNRPAAGNKSDVAQKAENKPRSENQKTNNTASPKASGGTNNGTQNQKKRRLQGRAARGIINRIRNRNAKAILRKAAATKLAAAKGRLSGAQRRSLVKLIKEGVAPKKAREIIAKKLNRAKMTNAI